MNFKDLKERVSKMAEGSTDTEALKELGSTLKMIDDMEAEHNKQVQEQEQLRKDYIEVVKSASFKTSPDDNKPAEEKTLEELMIEQARKERQAKQK